MDNNDISSGGLLMPTTMTITLDSEIQEALNHKSRQLHLDPETAVVQLIRDFVQGRLLLADQEFAEGLTVAEYVALNDEQEAALWDRWYTEADRQVGHIIAEASPDALPPR
jgi:predicted transcriptional regulator